MCDPTRLSSEVYQFDGFSFYHSLEPPNYWSDHGHEEIQIALPQPNALAWMQYQSSTGQQFSRKIKSGQAFYGIRLICLFALYNF